MYSFRSKVMAAAVFLLASIVMVIASAMAGDGRPAGPFYQMQWQCRELSAELAINGVPLMRKTCTSSVFDTQLLNLWMKPGVNDVVVKVNPPTKPVEFERIFSVLLEKDKPGQFVGDGEIIFKFAWTEDDDKKQVEKKFEFTPQAASPIQLWVKSEQINLDANAEKEIRAYLRAVSDAYMKADIDKLAHIVEFKTSEYGMVKAGRTASLSEIKELLRQNFRSLKSSKMKFRPIDVAGAKLELVGDKKIIMVTDKDGQPPLVAVAPKGESSQEYKMYLARINGQWVWAR